MSQFPQLVQDDFDVITTALKELLARSEASTALFVEKAGYLINECGESTNYNTTELATLGANAFAATQFMADRLSETNFSGMFQQGEQMSVLWLNIDENSLLMVIFQAHLSVGAIKYYALDTVKVIAAQLLIAQERAPGQGVDLATMDATDIDAVFQRKQQ